MIEAAPRLVRCECATADQRVQTDSTPCRKLEGELGPLPYEGPGRAGRTIPVGTGREVPPEVLDSLRGLNRQQLTNMLINYYHSIRGPSFMDHAVLSATQSEAFRCASH